MNIDMQETQKLAAKPVAAVKRLREPVTLKDRLFLILLIVIAALYLSPPGVSAKPQVKKLAAAPVKLRTVALNGADRWEGDTTTTVPNFDFSKPGAGTLDVAALFQDYYSGHQGSTSLGTPLTVAFPTEEGWIQFFSWGALLLPSVQQSVTVQSDLLFQTVINNGISDEHSKIVRLPLLQALLTVGSQVPVSDNGNSLTYGDIRKEIGPNDMLSEPAIVPLNRVSLARKHATFIQGGTRNGKVVGYLIPAEIWAYINRATISPDGWQKDFGAPLTQVLSFPITRQGQVHHMQLQIFGNEGVMLDQSTLDASGQPLVQMLSTGLAYLRTIGPPAVTTQAQQSVWSQGNAALLSAPKNGQAIAHIGDNFPLVLKGKTSWNKGNLWYQIQWTPSRKKSDGWVNASAITFSSPGRVPGWASIDALSPDLSRYLNGISSDVNVSVYDVTRQRYYTFNPDVQFITGSSMKVFIMLTLLDQTESQGGALSSQDMDLLTKMIENSDNDAASQLYFKEIGGATGVINYLNKMGISGLDPNPAAWGMSQITPMAMITALTDLYTGKTLTAQDRDLAFSLMENVESDQRFGVGDTAPASANIAMKNGWLPGPDGLWAVNSSGIVMNGNEVYIISVYTEEQSSFEDGQATLDHICGLISSQLK